MNPANSSTVMSPEPSSRTYADYCFHLVNRLMICSATYYTVILFKFPVLEAKITVSPRRGAQPILSAHEKTLVLQGLAIIRETLQTREVGDEGLEAFGSYPLFNRLRPVLVKQLGAHTGAELPLSQVVALLIERWSYMTYEERGALVALLKILQ